MKVVTKYESNSGKLFDSKEECLNYERGEELRKMFISLFEPLYEDLDSEDIGPEVLAHYCMNKFYMLKGILKTKEVL